MRTTTPTRRPATDIVKQAVADLTAIGWPTSKIAEVFDLAPRTVRDWRAERREAEEAAAKAEADRLIAEAARNHTGSRMARTPPPMPRSPTP